MLTKCASVVIGLLSRYLVLPSFNRTAFLCFSN
jgi:hypothetical protein